MDMRNILLLCLIHNFYNLFLVKKISEAWEFCAEFFIWSSLQQNFVRENNKQFYRFRYLQNAGIFINIIIKENKIEIPYLPIKTAINLQKKNLRTLNIKHTIPYSQYLPTPPQIVILLENISNLKRIPPLIPLRRARVKNKRKKCDTRYTQAEADVDRHGGYIPRFFTAPRLDSLQVASSAEKASIETPLRPC